MTTFFLEGGSMMWLLLLFAIFIVVLSVKKGLQLFGKNEIPRSSLENGINAIIFWGAISAVLGFFAHHLGIYHAMRAIAAASDVSPAIVSYGYSMSLVTVLTGLMIFIISALIWFLLRWRLKKITQTAA
ncbi:MAG: hypothetical protein E4H13_09930 [Calditrichales bacterium]|nr:MAG: hypothetical protein E4H13_09930 [Calditrichales bacterium]